MHRIRILLNVIQCIDKMPEKEILMLINLLEVKFSKLHWKFVDYTSLATTLSLCIFGSDFDQ